MRQEKKHRRWPWIVLILVLLAVIAALGYGFWSKMQAESNLPVLDDDSAVTEQVQDTDGEDTTVVDDPVVDDPIVDEPPVDDTVVDEPPVDEPEVPVKTFDTAGLGTIETGGYELSDEHIQLMYDFMTAWYQPLISLGEVDMSGLFSREVQSDSHADALRTLILIRQRSLTDLRMKNLSYVLTVTDVEWEDGRLRVEADENTVMNFMATPDTDSILYDLPHIFIFDDSGERLKLHHHEADDNPYFSYLRAENSDYDDGIDIILRSIENHQSQRGVYSPVTWYTADHPYDREAALDYLYEYCGKRNPRWYAYDAVGGNCMNFGSQVLLAGGIPEDEQGSAQWYWDDQYDLALSWINVGRFYDYCRDNYGYGLVADTEAGYYTGEVGDVLIVGYDDEHRHTTIISDIVYDENGEAVDYLISCNTTNYRDFPVSAYYYTFHRLIKIIGWNE